MDRIASVVKDVVVTIKVVKNRRATLNQFRMFYLDMKKISQYLLVVLLLVTTAQIASAETRYRVKSSDNLNGIVERFYENSSLSKGQLMVGVLAKNPRAFKGGNINFLLRGKRLILPNESEIEQISPEIASKLLSQHARLFRIGITGDFKAPTIEDLLAASDKLKSDESKTEVSDSSEILKTQTRKIDQLQQESNELKKQLEELLNAKGDRDNRLLELEKSLKQTQDIARKTSAQQTNEGADSEDKTSELETAKKQLQQKQQETKSELVENTNSNIARERKVEDQNAESFMVPPSIGDTKNETGVPAKIESSEGNSSMGNSLAKLLWLLPLILLAGFLFRYFGKKQAVVSPEDDTIAHYEAEYLEAKKDIDPEFEEEALETSIKLDVARAYIEAEDTPSALDILTEIMEEGSDEQRQQAHELLEKISSS